MVGQLHNRWMFAKADCSKNLQIENRSSPCQRWSLYGFQTSHFICDRFCSKLWFQLIQNHAWHCFLIADSIEIFIPQEKKKVTCRGTRAVSRPEIYKALKPCWLLNWVSIVRCSMFSSSEPVAVSSYCCRLGNALCLCSPVRPAQAEPESGPKSLAIDFAL